MSFVATSPEPSETRPTLIIIIIIIIIIITRKPS